MISLLFVTRLRSQDINMINKQAITEKHNPFVNRLSHNTIFLLPDISERITLVESEVKSWSSFEFFIEHGAFALFIFKILKNKSRVTVK